jgi:hypothetical protein
VSSIRTWRRFRRSTTSFSPRRSSARRRSSPSAAVWSAT